MLLKNKRNKKNNFLIFLNEKIHKHNNYKSVIITDVVELILIKLSLLIKYISFQGCVVFEECTRCPCHFNRCL